MFVYPLTSKLAFFYHKANSSAAPPQPLWENLLVVFSIFSNSFCAEPQLVWQIKREEQTPLLFPAGPRAHENTPKSLKYLNLIEFSSAALLRSFSQMFIGSRTRMWNLWPHLSAKNRLKGSINLWKWKPSLLLERHYLKTKEGVGALFDGKLIIDKTKVSWKPFLTYTFRIGPFKITMHALWLASYGNCGTLFPFTL